MLIQIHILQNYAPANLNRDDSGSPKDAIFGGTSRGRISSQCLKRSIRNSATFKDAFEAEGLLGMRTKGLPNLVKQELEKLNADEKTIQAIVARVPEIGKKAAKGKAEEDGEAESAETPNEVEEIAETRQLIFIARNEIQPLAQKLLDFYKGSEPKKWKDAAIDKVLGKSLPRSMDIAMFGRMTTAETFEDVHAAVQVAHALSTNTLTQEFDYYTVVDDLSGESGAGMIGDVEFNSSTYYKYLNVHWEQLVKNLGGEAQGREFARRAVLALLEAAALAQPSGKQNSFAAHSLPDLILVEVSDKNLPVSYANAFLKPARATGEATLMDASAHQLADYIERLSRTFTLTPKRAFAATQDYTIPGAAAQSSLGGLQAWLEAQITA
jgi:CRISPR system Cascade subunit CasC